jgi:hypothetical protein
MDRDVEQFERLETELFNAMGEAERRGLASGEGQFAFRRAMTALDLLAEERTAGIYDILAADPLTRDYVTHLDGQLRGLSARIDIHRTRIELGLLTGRGDIAALNMSLARLVRQLKARFRREAALMPVYAGWLGRQTETGARA